MSKSNLFVIGESDEGFPLNVDLYMLADTRGLITASSGMGKSWLFRLICERVSKHIQTVIIDSEGEFSTLREHLDILVVSESGDVKPDIRSAGLLARKLVETGVSAVIDIYDLPGKGDPWDKRRLYVYAFLNGLMSIPKSLYHPMLVMIDEAHNFASENPTKSGEKLSEIYFKERVSTGILSRSAVRILMSAGRKRGIGGLLATQRVSKIDKDSIADIRNYMIGGTTLDIDRDRAGEILGMNKAQRVTLRDMNPGDFYTFGPAIMSKGVSLFTSHNVLTTHPKAGQQRVLEVPKASNHIAQIASQFADIPAEAVAEGNRLESMQNEIARLKRDLSTRPVETRIETVRQEPVKINVPVISDQQYGSIISALSNTANKLNELLAQKSALHEETMRNLNKMLEDIATPKSILDSVREELKGRKTLPATQSPVRRGEPVKNTIHSDEALTAPQQRILDAIAWLESVRLYDPRRTVIAFLAGQSPRSSGYTNNLGALRSAGLITYPNSESLAFTDSGRAAANHLESPLDSRTLQETILSRLPRPQARILEVLIAADGSPIDRTQLALDAGQSPTSSGYTNNLGTLRSLGVIDYPNSSTARALPVLWV